MVHPTSNMGMISRSHKIGVASGMDESGNPSTRCPVSRCEGVSGYSRSSAAMKVSGLELRDPSISTSVDRSS